MENVKAIIKKTIAILTVFILILTQYVITGLIEATYAIDLLATQNANVQFGAYFKNGEEETTEIERSIDAKDIKLKIDVAVKEQGYFNGKISLENAGFKIKGATENSYINKVENNVVYLNQINAEETASIELEIEYLEEERIQVATLNSPTTIKLKGTYTFSGGTETIDSGSDVKVIWNVPEGTKAELASKILTNAIYKVGEENKKIVQFLISSQLTNNGYPIKATEITATIPEGATKVEVRKRTTKSTNGDQEFTEANNVSREGNNVKITVNNNEEDGKISWMKGVKDIYVVTYEYPEDIDLSTQNITVNEKITTENNIELNAEPVQVQLNERKEGIATVSKQEGEDNIYKGKIYSGEGRDITSYTLVYVDYVEGIKEIEIAEEEAKYAKKVEENGETNTVESNANVEIKSIKINKDEVASVLGDTWSIVIGETTLTNETEADENGDIIVQISEGTKTTTIKTSKPANNGTFVIETVKTIKNTTNTREEKKEFTILKDRSSVKCKKNNDDEFKFTSTYDIGLKDTESKASMQSEQQALIATGEAQSLNLTVILESNNEKQDLYKNPTLKIKLPRQITSVTSAQLPQLINANGLTLTENNYTIEEENGQKVINIKLTGEQTKYLGEAIQGTTIPIKLMINVNPNAEDSVEEIVMTYINENATKYTDNGTQKLNVEIIAKQNQGQEENQNENNGQDQQQGENQNDNSGQGQQQNENQNNGNEDNTDTDLTMELTAKVGGKAISSGDTVKAGEIIEYIAQIKNTGNTDKTGISIEATIPENTKLIDIDPDYPAYDSQREEYIDDRNYLIEKADRKITKENVSIKVGETIIVKYMVRVNTNITEEKNIENEINIKSNNSVIQTTRFQNQIQKGKLQVEYVPIFRKPGEKLSVSFNYVDKVYIKNISNEEQKNVEVTINKSNTVSINKLNWYIDEDNYGKVDISKSTFTVNSLPANQTLEIIIDKTVSNYIDNKIINESELMVEVKDEDGEIYKSNNLVEEIKGVNVIAIGNTENISNNNNSGYVNIGDRIKYSISLENIGEYDADNMYIYDEISKYLKIEKVLLNQRECEYTVENRMTENEDNYNMISINTKLKKGEKANIEIICEVLNDLIQYETKDVEVINNAQISNDGTVLAKIQETKYVLRKNNNADNTEPNGNNNNNNNNNGNKYTISGTAWLDTDEDGQRSSKESVLSNINVSILNLKDNSITNVGTTNEEGKYNVLNLDKGEYYIIFEFDTSKYRLTKYHASNVNPLNNSDVENINMNINNKYTTVASTDKITIDKASIECIDLGLIEKKNSNLILEKTISKITVTNSGGTKTVKYNDPALAKVEIRSKYLKNSTVIIEYNIKVTNVGETAEYVKNIVDYIPSSLTFNSKLNKKWYKKGKNIYTKSLANTKIEPGESKVVKLIMTKKMTESNTGLINNKAEIISSYNDKGEESTNNSENNIGNADVIISVSTGTAINYLIITIIISLMISTIIYLIIMKKLKESTEY